MIKLLSGSLIALTTIATPASFAGQILSNMYAREYCSLRALGVSKDEAMNAAFAEAYVTSLPDKPIVTIDGTQASSDLVAAARTAYERCPQYFGS